MGIHIEGNQITSSREYVLPIDISLSPVHMLMDSSVIYAHQLVLLCWVVLALYKCKVHSVLGSLNKEKTLEFVNFMTHASGENS